MLTHAPAPAAAAAGRPPKTFTLEQLASRSDALALSMGSRATASTIMLAAVVVILIGAQSLLGTMEGVNRDIVEMNEQLAIANAGLVVLNETMESVPPMSEHMTGIVGTVQRTSDEVKVSAGHIGTMSTTTTQLNDQIGSIASSTTSMRGSLQDAATNTDSLSKTIDELNAGIDPLVRTQHQLLLGTRRMRTGLDGMNASLAYVVRVLNYIAAPPTGGGMTMRVDLPKQTLPPLPGIKADVEPVNVFPRNIWPVYTGP